MRPRRTAGWSRATSSASSCCGRRPPGRRSTMADSPYPELKKSHTMARTGRPWTDVKPPPAAPVWRVIQGFADYWVLVAAIELGVFDALDSREPRSAGDLSATVGSEPSRTAALLDALVAMGFVEEAG